MHRVTAEVKNGNTGNITCKVQGEWNSNFEFQYSDVSSFALYQRIELDDVSACNLALPKIG